MATAAATCARAAPMRSAASRTSSRPTAGPSPIALPARVEGEAYRALVDGEVVPIHRADVLRAAGVEFAGAVEPETPCVLVELESPSAAPVFLVGLQNFYSLTRYNRSSFYAAAVNDLAEEIGVAYRSR
jgi:membrane-bound lytic murein transglycosylase B